MDPDKDPKQMSDEELQAAIDGGNTNPNGDEPNPTGEETPIPEPKGDEPARNPDGTFAPKEGEPNPEADPSAAPEPQHDPNEEKPLTRRQELRIQQVLDRVKGNKPPTQQPSQPQYQPRKGAIDYANELDADPEVIARLEEDRKVAENARYQEGLQQAQGYEWRTLLQVDAPQMEREHPQLDKRSPEFHPALSNAMSTMYLQMSGFNEETGLPASPGMRWSEFVESFWELADEIGSLKTQKATQQVAQQAANTGLRPNGESTKLNLDKAPEHMSDAELDAYLASQGLAPKKR